MNEDEKRGWEEKRHIYITYKLIRVEQKKGVHRPRMQNIEFKICTGRGPDRVVQPV